MNRKSSGYYAVLGVVLVMIMSIVSVGDMKAQECRVVRIGGMVVHDSIAVEPERMLISKGTCVIWFNRAKAANVKIKFEEGKACAAATEAPVQFHMDDYGQCFVTSWVPFGGTSSLSFKEKGTYKYVIEMAPGGPEDLGDKGKKIAEGTIIVSE